MGKALNPHPVKLIIGFIYHDEALLKKVTNALRRSFGTSDFESETLAFTYTDYYENEMGLALKRKFIAFRTLIDPQKLASIKALTNKIELAHAKAGKRKINIDPGYLDMAKLVLATTKDFAHRIYLDKGIFAEVTLVYQKKSFRVREWTYPDFRTNEYIRIFNHIRDLYEQQTKNQ